jgi:hypothetical protein
MNGEIRNSSQNDRARGGGAHAQRTAEHAPNTPNQLFASGSDHRRVKKTTAAGGSLARWRTALSSMGRNEASLRG